MHGTSVIPQETVLFVVKPNYKNNFPKLSGGKLDPSAATVFHEHILLLYGLWIINNGSWYIILLCSYYCRTLSQNRGIACIIYGVNNITTTEVTTSTIVCVVPVCKLLGLFHKLNR